MEEVFSSQYRNIPDWIFIGSVGLLSLLIVVIFLTRKEVALIRRDICLSLLLVYLFLVLCSTLIFRTENSCSRLELMPIWNYRELFIEHKIDDIWTAVLNLFLLLPVGVLVPICFKHLRWYHVLFIGFSISAAIELLQLLTARGMCETDDVIYNTLGCLAGYWLIRKCIALQ